MPIKKNIRIGWKDEKYIRQSVENERLSADTYNYIAGIVGVHSEMVRDVDEIVSALDAYRVSKIRDDN